MAGYKKFTGHVVAAQANIIVELECGTRVVLHEDLGESIIDREVEVYACSASPKTGVLGFGSWNYKEGSWLDKLVNYAMHHKVSH